MFRKKLEKVQQDLQGFWHRDYYNKPASLNHQDWWKLMTFLDGYQNKDTSASTDFACSSQDDPDAFWRKVYKIFRIARTQPYREDNNGLRPGFVRRCYKTCLPGLAYVEIVYSAEKVPRQVFLKIYWNEVP